MLPIGGNVRGGFAEATPSHSGGTSIVFVREGSTGNSAMESIYLPMGYALHGNATFGGESRVLEAGFVGFATHSSSAVGVDGSFVGGANPGVVTNGGSVMLVGRNFGVTPSVNVSGNNIESFLWTSDSSLSVDVSLSLSSGSFVECSINGGELRLSYSPSWQSLGSVSITVGASSQEIVVNGAGLEGTVLRLR